MSSYKKGICVLLVMIATLSIILIIKINDNKSYDPKLYSEIYDEYNAFLSQIGEDTEITDYSIYTNNNVIVNPNTIASNNASTSASSSSASSKSSSSIQSGNIIGRIIIPKIHITYPILKETSNEFLKIAPSKLAGPDINKEGNLCIAGHNYKDDTMFSKISELEVGDFILITSGDGKSLGYRVYKKYETNEKDLSCTSQDTNGNIEVTLITCTKQRSNRLVVKCKAE